MIWLIAILVVVAVITLSFLGKQRRTANIRDESKYRRQNALFTEAEMKFLAALESALGGRYRVFGKVRVADVIEPIAARGTGSWQSAFNRIQSKHFDFVLCDPADLNIVAAIELDDSSHIRRNRRDRDDFLDQACKSANQPLVRFSAKAGYAAAAVQARLAEVIKLGEPAPPGKAARLCPNCGRELERISGGAGALAGRPFWRCSRYPGCRTVIPVLDGNAG